MSEPENFLSRWSRRKLEVEQPKEEKEEQRAEPAAEATDVAKPDAPEAAAPTSQSEAPAAKEEPEFDVSTLPSIELITSATDVRVFLQKGVPADLTRAALRRAWTADPSIRDFIGIAENQYDFATGSDIPGFGALDASADEIKRMVAEVFGDGLKSAAEAETVAKAPEAPQTVAPDAGPATSEPKQDLAAGPEDQPASESSPAGLEQDIVHRNEVNIAMQQSTEGEEYEPQSTRRPHGRALPQ